MTEISFHPDAEAEYQEAIDWYQARDSAVAADWVEGFERAVESIRQYPEMHTRYDETHRFVIPGRFPYALLYRTDSDRVRVVAVAHNKRKPGYWEGRV